MEENNSKEINLLDLLNLLFNWLKGIIISLTSFVGKLFRLMYRYWILTVSITLICFLAGLYLSRPQARVYKAESFVTLNGVDVQTVREISKQLENSDPSVQSNSFASKLSLPDSVAKNIVGFHSYYVIAYLKDRIAVKVDYADNFSQKDTMYIKMDNHIQFQLLTKNISQIPIVQKAILNYFYKNELLQTNLKISRNNLNDQIRISNLELNRIDSLAKLSYLKDNIQQLRFNQNKLLLGDQQKQLFYNDLLRLQSIISNSQGTLLKFDTPIDLPSGFVVNPTPINGMFKYGLQGIIFGLLISAICVFIVNNLGKVFKYLKN